MTEIILCVVGLCLALAGFFELLGRVNYRITSRRLEVRLFGLCLRQVPLADIKRVSKRREGFGEPWPNTLFTRKRVLVITRRSGWAKRLIITPERRYLFRARLRRAIARARGEHVAEPDSELVEDGDYADDEDED